MKCILIILLAITGAASVGHAADSEKQSGGFIPSKAEETLVTADPFLLGPVYGYQKHISPVLGGKCPMNPSCSQYCVHAVKKHGFVMGWIMACDRLMRCGRDELETSRSIRKNSSILCDDPVSNNDFWLRNKP